MLPILNSHNLLSSSLEYYVIVQQQLLSSVEFKQAELDFTLETKIVTYRELLSTHLVFELLI